MSALPDAEASYPTCGACRSETDHDGDNFTCYGCGLMFDNDDLTASYIDPDLKPCGQACGNTWHRPQAINLGYSYECQPCALPEGHESDHWTGCVAVKLATREAS